jgi:translation initiation factor IF-1
MNPIIIMEEISNDKKVAMILLAPHFSILLTSGKSINAIINAKLKGNKIDLAKIIAAKRANTVAMTKNVF